jgi:hypothetical protein
MREQHGNSGRVFRVRLVSSSEFILYIFATDGRIARVERFRASSVAEARQVAKTLAGHDDAELWQQGQFVAEVKGG